MLRHKDTVILSEIKDFITTSDKAIETILCFMSSLTFSGKQVGLPQAVNFRFLIFKMLLIIVIRLLILINKTCSAFRKSHFVL